MDEDDWFFYDYYHTENDDSGSCLGSLLKLMFLPFWFPFWLIGKIFK